ncbi:MAG: Na+/H+ antiporter NhaC [Lachnospiraceae bacterium]|nr:Na+/H+ antiporter NhaC [Lachnospiraceae bacterium]
MKNIFTEEREIKRPTIGHALISLLGLVAVMVVGIVIFGADPHIPMFMGVIIAAIVSMTLGYKWSDLESMMIDGISKAMQSVLILAIVGMMIGAWLLSGTIPTMIYYGLKLLSPKVFLVAAVLICSITSLATGTSWGTMGTMGLALIGIGAGLGMPVGPTAGAVISGAYFGDKLSPLSDTTNLAPAMAGTDVFTHVKYMLKSTLISYVIALFFFGVYGFMHVSSGSVDSSQAAIIMGGIKSNFNVNPLLLLPPLIVILAIAFKIPAIPGITMGFIAALILAPVFQQGVTFSDMLDASLNGFVCETDVDALNSLLSSGGLLSMGFSILMVLIAMMYGGIMEGTRQMEVIIEALLKVIKGPAALIGATELTCIFANAIMAEQYISILIPGRMFAPAYREKGIHPKSLSNALESAGTVTSCLVPWNTCGMFIASTLGIAWAAYAPWAVFNYTMPVVCFVMALFGVTVTSMTPEEQEKANRGELV